MISEDDKLLGSQRHMGRKLLELYDPINPEDDTPVETTFIKALTVHFEQCEITEKWTRK